MSLVVLIATTRLAFADDPTTEERIQALEERVAELEGQVSGLPALPPPTSRPIDWSDARFVAITATDIVPKYDTDDVRDTLESDVEEELKRCLNEGGFTYTPVRGQFRITRTTQRASDLFLAPTIPVSSDPALFYACFVSAFARFQMPWNGDLDGYRIPTVTFAFEAPNGYVLP